MTALVLAVGVGAPELWQALRESVHPHPRATVLIPRQLRCSCRLPKSAHPGAKAVFAEIYNAEDSDHALQAVKAFEADYGRES